MSNEDIENRGYTKGYAARDKSAKAKIKDLQKEVSRLTVQNTVLQKGMINSVGPTHEVIKIFSFFWLNSNEPDHIRWLALTFPDLIHHCQLIKNRGDDDE